MLTPQKLGPGKAITVKVFLLHRNYDDRQYKLTQHATLEFECREKLASCGRHGRLDAGRTRSSHQASCFFFSRSPFSGETPTFPTLRLSKFPKRLSSNCSDTVFWLVFQYFAKFSLICSSSQSFSAICVSCLLTKLFLSL